MFILLSQALPGALSAETRYSPVAVRSNFAFVAKQGLARRRPVAFALILVVVGALAGIGDAAEGSPAPASTDGKAT